MMQRLSQLFQSKKSFFSKQLKKLSFATECPKIDSNDVIFLIDSFNTVKPRSQEQLKQNQHSYSEISNQSMKEFLDFINEINANSKSYIVQLKLLIVLHILISNDTVGKRMCKQFLQRKFHLHNYDRDQILYSIELVYYQYISKYSIYWNEINKNQVANGTFYYFNYVNLSNIILSIVPQFKKYLNTPIFPLIKQMALILYRDVERYFKALRLKIIDDLKNLRHIGEQIIEVQQLYNELNILSERMLNFYQFIVEFEETRKILPPKSINISPELQNEIVKLNENQMKQSENKKLLKQFQKNQSKQNQSVEQQVQTAKCFLKQDISYERPIKEISNDNLEKNQKQFSFIQKHPSRTTEEDENIVGKVEVYHK